MDGVRTTCWRLVEDAARGEARAREEFVRRYLPVVTAYLRSRWRGAAWLGEIDDAVQEVFLECFRARGALERFDRAPEGVVEDGEQPVAAGSRSFRAYLYGLARNVARRFEERAARRRRLQESHVDLDAIERDEAKLSRVFDRSFALSLVRSALDRLAERERASPDGAGERGAAREGTGGGEGTGAREMTRHRELLELRFAEGLPVREIAARWNLDPTRVHRWYARARAAFRRELIEIVREQNPGAEHAAERLAAELLTLVR